MKPKPKPRKHLILLADKDFSSVFDDTYLSLSKLVETDYHVIYYTEGAYSNQIDYTYHIKVFSDFIHQFVEDYYISIGTDRYKAICEYVRELCIEHGIKVDCFIEPFLYPKAFEKPVD